MKKKKILRIINNENSLNNFLSTSTSKNFLIGIRQSIEIKNFDVFKKFIHYNNNFKNEKLKQYILNQSLEFSIISNYYEGTLYLLKNSKMNIDNEFILNSIKKNGFPLNSNFLSVILENVNFKKEHFIILVSWYLINTDFVNKIDILQPLKDIYSFYSFSAKEIYDFLFLNNLFQSIDFQVKNSFNEDNFSFLDFIIYFDKDNYIINKLSEYSKYIDDYNLYEYINYLNKIKIKENFDNF